VDNNVDEWLEGKLALENCRDFIGLIKKWPKQLIYV